MHSRPSHTVDSTEALETLFQRKTSGNFRGLKWFVAWPFCNNLLSSIFLVNVLMQKNMDSWALFLGVNVIILNS